MHPYLEQVVKDYKTTRTSLSFKEDNVRLSVRAACSVTFAIFLAMWLDTDQPYWSGMTAFICTETTIGSTLLKSTERFLGTICGAGLGLLSIVLFVTHPPVYLIVVFIVSMVGIYLAAIKTEHLYAWLLGYISALMVMLGSLQNPTPEAFVHMAFFRSFEITIGVFSSSLMGFIIFPNPAQPVFSKSLMQSMTDLRTLLTDYSELLKHADPDAEQRYKDLSAKLVKNKDKQDTLLLHAIQEGHWHKHQRLLNQHMLNLRDLLESVNASFRCTILQSPDIKFRPEHHHEIDKLAAYWLDTFASYQQQLENNQSPKLPDEIRLAAGEQLEKVTDICFHEARLADEKARIAWLTLAREIYLINLQIRLFEYTKSEFSKPAEPRKPRPSLKRRIKFWYQGLKDDSYLFAYAANGAAAILFVPMFWLYFNLPGYFQVAVSIGAVIGLHPDATQFKGFLRFCGCLVGSVLAFIVLGLDIDSFSLWLAIIFAVVFTLSTMHFKRLKSSYVANQAAFVFIIGAVNSIYPAESIVPAFERLMGIFLGAISIVCFQHLFWPYRRFDEEKHHLRQMIKTSEHLFRTVLRASASTVALDWDSKGRNALSPFRRAMIGFRDMKKDGLNDNQIDAHDQLTHQYVYLFHNLYAYLMLLDKPSIREQADDHKALIRNVGRCMAHLQNACRKMLASNFHEEALADILDTPLHNANQLRSELLGLIDRTLAKPAHVMAKGEERAAFDLLLILIVLHNSLLHNERVVSHKKNFLSLQHSMATAKPSETTK